MGSESNPVSQGTLTRTLRLCTNWFHTSAMKKQEYTEVYSMKTELLIGPNVKYEVPWKFEAMHLPLLWLLLLLCLPLGQGTHVDLVHLDNLVDL